MLSPGEQVRGELDKFEPDLVRGEVVQRQVPQPGVLEAADPVYGAGPHPVLHFQLADPPAVSVGDLQLRAGVRPFPPGDDPPPGRPRFLTPARIW